MLKINIDQGEYLYLIQANFLPPKLKERLLQSKKNVDYYSMLLSEEQADEIRDLCGEQLQLIGFDEKYELTPEGVILESLVDKFFIG